MISLSWTLNLYSMYVSLSNIGDSYARMTLIKYYCSFYNLVPFYLKSMKFFTYASALLFASTRQQAGECGEGRVVNKMQFCIRPRYIEGC